MDRTEAFRFPAEVRAPHVARADRLGLVRPQRKRWELPEEGRRNDWLTKIGERPLQLLSKEERISEQWRQASLALRHCVEVSARKFGGIPVLKGTRFPIAQVLSQIAEGDSVDDLAENFDLDPECLRTLLHALAACLDRPFYR